MFRFLVISAFVTCAFGHNILPRFLSPTSRIVGGQDTTIENHPYQVSIRIKGEHQCGGSILTNRKILTAAHCCGLPASDYTIQYGITKRGTNENVISVAKVNSHPNWNSNTITNDICVLLLRDDIHFSESAQPIKLAKEEPSAGEKANVTGWGLLKEHGSQSIILQGVEVNIIDREECKLSNAKVDNTMVCAGNEGSGKDFCNTDSGGPLVVDDKLVGVVSWNEGCGRAGFPGVYANVAGLRDWIDLQ